MPWKLNLVIAAIAGMLAGYLAEILRKNNDAGISTNGHSQ
jgi:hypothetical protein